MTTRPRLLRIQPPWVTLATAHAEGEHGDVRIRRERYTRGVYAAYGTHPPSSEPLDFYALARSMDVTVLQLRHGKQWRTWMVDDPPHEWAMRSYAEEAHGSVLVAGVGLGLVLGHLLDNERVESVTAVDRNADVIALNRRHPRFADEDTPVIFVESDFESYIAETDVDYDSIIVDLWVANGEDRVRALCDKEVVPLMRKVIKRWPEAHHQVHGFGPLWYVAYDVLADRRAANG